MVFKKVAHDLHMHSVRKVIPSRVDFKRLVSGNACKIRSLIQSQQDFLFRPSIQHK